MSAAAASPWASLQPKHETLAAKFIADTGADGTGVVVAILDTGVDPAAAGLAVCPDGRPKVIDILDCTGSGDVDTSTVASSTALPIKGLSGRTLKLNPKWVNPSGEWRLGVKRAFELYPRGLAARVKEKRKKEWDDELHRQETALKRALDAAKAGNDADAAKDLEARCEHLSAFAGAREDPGPLYDAVVWHDGEEWCAALDTSETGDLSAAAAMRSYRVAREYATLNSAFDNLTYCVTVCDGGDVLSICVDAGAHGTHVAGIVAAHHPDRPEQ